MKTYLEASRYIEAANTVHGIVGACLFALARHDLDTKHQILRNTLARSSMSLKAVVTLWEASNVHDAWAVHRSLIERLLHITHLGATGSYEEFEKWSFLEQCKAQNSVRSDPKFKHEADHPAYKLTDEQRGRLKILSRSPPQWRRPRPEDVAKGMELGFLYKYGYDFASMHVHPMATDGEQDFFTITGLKPESEFPDQSAVLSNSLLAVTLVVQEALNQSAFRWRKVLWEYVDAVRCFLDDGDPSYRDLFVRVLLLGKELSLCEPVV